MAYVPQDDEEQKQQAAAAEGGSQPGLLGGGRPSAGPSRSNFVNVTEYLTKNPNEGENLVNRVVGNLEKEKSDVQSGISSANEQFGQRVNATKVDMDSDFLKGAFDAPEEFVKNDQNVARFQAMRDAAYKGPSNLEETDLFAPVQSKVDALKQKGQSLSTEAGRNAVLSPLSERPTAGKTALNQMILQGTPDAAQKLQAAAGTFPAVEEQWNQVRQQAGQTAAGAKAATEATRKATNEGLTAATGGFQTDLAGKVSKATQERDAFNSQYQAIMQALADHSGTSLRPEQLKALGIENAYPYLAKLNEFNKNIGGYGTPVNLDNYVIGGSAASNLPTAESVADPTMYAREAALQKLSGADLGLPDEVATPYSMNGHLPGVDYMSAFKKGGSDLKAADEALLQYWATPGADPSRLSDAKMADARMKTPEYYTSPSATATPPPDYGIAPPPAGWDASQPIPYPMPTSQPPANLINPRWNQYTGQWEGAQLQPTDPIRRPGVFY